MIIRRVSLALTLVIALFASVFGTAAAGPLNWTRGGATTVGDPIATVNGYAIPPIAYVNVYWSKCSDPYFFTYRGTEASVINGDCAVVRVAVGTTNFAATDVGNLQWAYDGSYLYMQGHEQINGRATVYTLIFSKVETPIQTSFYLGETFSNMHQVFSSTLYGNAQLAPNFS